MLRTALLAGFIVATMLARPVCADGLIYQLPKDGSSATFAMEYKATTRGKQDTRKGTFIISSVGEAIVENEKRRWLEFMQVLKFGFDGKVRTSVTTALIPEKHIGNASSQVVVVADNWDELARRLKQVEPDPGKTFGVEVGCDYDAVQEIW
jgi:hypothetical protein